MSSKWKVNDVHSSNRVEFISIDGFSTDDNDPIVFCDRCGIIVHESCYNADSLDEKSSDSSSPSEYWFCTPCLAQIDDPTCALCPSNDHCQPFWPTLESTWIHCVCALAVPGVLFYDELYYTPVDISNIQTQKFGNKFCQICQLRSGITVSCDAGLCPNAFHISCANKNGLLQIRGELSKIECELYCVTHQSSTNQYKTFQRHFSICEVQQKEFDRRFDLEEDIRQTLNEQFNNFQKRSTLFPKLPKPTKTHSSRSLMVDTVALKEFFVKSQRLCSTNFNDQHSKTLNLTNMDLTLPENNALLGFIENENELKQLRQNLLEKEEKFNELHSSTIENQLKQEQIELEMKLKEEYKRFDSIHEKYQQLRNVLKKYNTTFNNLDEFCSNKMKSSNDESQCCSVCHQSDRSNQMIKCCQCRLSYHGDCLNPAMPAKTLSIILSATKKYEWQCALCVNAQQEELDQRHVDVDQPRQTRPRKTNELVLRESLIKFGSRKRKDLSQSNLSEESTKEKKKCKHSSNHSKKETDSKQENNSTIDQTRTSLIQKLFNRKSKEFTGNLSSTKKKTNQRSSSFNKRKSKISIRKSSKTSIDVEERTSERSKSSPEEKHRRSLIFKQKSLSLPSMKHANEDELSSNHSSPKLNSNKKNDPLAIFDFSDEEEDNQQQNEQFELHSSLNKTLSTDSNRQTKKIQRKTSLRSKTNKSNEN